MGACRTGAAKAQNGGGRCRWLGDGRKGRAAWLPEASLERGANTLMAEGRTLAHDVENKASIKDPEAFKIIYEEHVNQVSRYIRSCGVYDKDVDDVTADIFLIVFKNFHSFRGESKIRSWIFAISTREAVRHVRKARLRRDVSDDVVALQEDATPNAEQLLNYNRILNQVLRMMSLEKAMVFHLFEIEGFTCPEIAETLEIPLGTVHSRLKYARDEFKTNMMMLENRKLL